MDKLFALSTGFAANIQLRIDDDVVDRLNHLYSGILLIIFSLLVSLKQYLGEPIICWVPPYISGRGDYIDNYCWISNTYWLSLDDQVPINVYEREHRELGYYQWVPILLLLQALFFYMPCMFWRSFNEHSGINVKSLVETAASTENLKKENRAVKVRHLVSHLDHCLTNQREAKTVTFRSIKQYAEKLGILRIGRKHGNFLFSLYILTKLLYLVNIVCQMLVINYFLDLGYTFLGVKLLKALQSGHMWEITGEFPRVTFCDFSIRVLGNLHRHSVQCVLPINLINEKVYIFLWFWFVFVFICTCINLLSWLYRVCLPINRRHFVKKALLIMKAIDVGNNRDRQNLRRFVNSYLRIDGLMVFLLVKNNTGDLLTNELAAALWRFHNKPEETEEKQDPEKEEPESEDSPRNSLDDSSDDMKKPPLPADDEVQPDPPAHLYPQHIDPDSSPPSSSDPDDNAALPDALPEEKKPLIDAE